MTENSAISTLCKVTPLHAAARFGNFEIAKFLVQNKANVNAKTGNGSYCGNATPLHDVAFNGDFKIAEFLLQNGAEVDATTFYCKKTPLHFAADEGNLKVVEVLLKHGARKDLKDWSGNTPLDLANVKKFRGAKGYFFDKDNGIENYQKIVALLETD